MKKRKKLFLVIPLILILSYVIYKKIAKSVENKKHSVWVESLANTAGDNVYILEDTINVDYLNEKRTLGLYLPANYLEDTLSYPVIYFLDGQSLFDQKIQEGMEWQVDEVLDSLGNLNRAQSIIVGIYNSEDRMKEYKPFGSTRWYSDKIVSGDKHAEWIAKTVKPWIDARYRTKTEPKHTTIGGASLGGLMSYYMLMEYPRVFGSAMVFSPSFWVNEIVYSLHKENEEVLNQKIYLNAGELETPTVESVLKMQKILVEYGVPKSNIKVDIEKGLGHWHMTWRSGFRKVYPWINNMK